MSALVAGWLLTYLMHSTLLLSVAWLGSRLLSDRQLALRETLWRLALFGGLLTASLQLAIGVAPIAGSWSLAETPSAVRSLPLELPPAGIGLDAREPVPPAPAAGPASAAAWTPRPSARPGHWERRLTRGWALIGLPLLVLLAVSYLRFRWRLRTRVDVEDGPLPELLRRLEARLAAGRRRALPARLTRSSRIGVPLARGVRRGEICLPAEALARLPVERQEIVVAHELAHLDRRDPLWFGLTRILERALFFQPLNALARRQLQEISEFRCDDWAVAATRRPISLAKCLTEVAEWSASGRAAVPVPTMAAGSTHLSRRVARLLQRSYPMPTETVPRWLAPVALIALLVTVLVAPGVSAHAPGSEARAAEPASPAAPAVPALPPAPAAPALAAPAPPPPPPAPARPDRSAAEGSSGELGDLEEFEAFRAFGAFEKFEELGELAGAMMLELEHLPMIAEISVEIAPALAAEHAELAAEVASALTEGLEFDHGQLERLRAMAERVEERGYATEAESARLAEMAELLIESARPSREQLERVRERARELTETRRKLLEEHRQRLHELRLSEREEMKRAGDEIRRSLEERRELLERARRQREESMGKLDREHRERLRLMMLRSREQLREQLRRLDEELERHDRDTDEGERSQPYRE